MKRFMRRCVCFLAGLSLLACSTMRVVAEGQGQLAQLTRAVPASLQVGDRISLYKAGGGKVEACFAGVEADRLLASVACQGPAIQFRADELITLVEKSEIDGIRTTVLIVGVLLLIAAGQLAKGVAFFPPAP